MARFGQALKPPKPLQQLSKALAPHRSGLNELSIYLSFYLSIYLPFSLYLSLPLSTGPHNSGVGGTWALAHSITY